MARGMIPFAYRSGKSPLHRCPAGLKLLGLLALSLGAFYSVYGLAAGAALLAGGAFLAGLRPWELLRGSKTVVVLALLLLLLRSFHFTGPEAAGLPLPDPEGFWAGLHQGLCFLLSFAAGSLLFAVTTMGELRDSLGRAETAAAAWVLGLGRLFRRGKNQAPPPKRRAWSSFSLGLSLMLGFLPRFFEIWETANLAYEARSGKKGLRRFVILAPLVIERMMEAAAETAEALDSRGLSLPPPGPSAG